MNKHDQWHNCNFTKAIWHFLVILPIWQSFPVKCWQTQTRLFHQWAIVQYNLPNVVVCVQHLLEAWYVRCGGCTLLWRLKLLTKLDAHNLHHSVTGGPCSWGSTSKEASVTKNHNTIFRTCQDKANNTNIIPRDVIMSRIREKSRVGGAWPTVVYIRINDVFVVLATHRLISCISHYSPVTSLYSNIITTSIKMTA